MKSHRDIVKGAGSPDAIAERHRVSLHTVRSWIQRDSIPADQWAAFALHGAATLAELAEYEASRSSKRERAA